MVRAQLPEAILEALRPRIPDHFSALRRSQYPLPDDGCPVDASTRLGFTVENVAEVIRALEGTSTRIVTLPKETAWGFQAVVKDPDGRSVELTQPR